MTAQIYQIRDYQPVEAQDRVLDEMTREIELYIRAEFQRLYPIIDNSPCERNPDDCA